MKLLSAMLVKTSKIDANFISELFDLFAAYYADVDFNRFQADIKAKDSLFVLSDKEDRVRGFSSLAISQHMIDGRLFRVVYSGDTIVDHRFWGEQALAFAWLEHAGVIKKQAPDIPLYWFLIVKGFRTYKYLPVFAKRFYPTWREKIPGEAKKIMDFLAREKFGKDYNAKTGIVHFQTCRGRLKQRWLAPADSKTANKDVDYFFSENPGHDKGDELVCLTELTIENMPPMAARIFNKGFQ
ncbi:MAG: hypothetical protein GY742_17210 [Hyphomicrobiales bacterium]|nr:hypothetical protein [Hyphomicrobiales bacterium]